MRKVRQTHLTEKPTATLFHFSNDNDKKVGLIGSAKVKLSVQSPQTLSCKLMEDSLL